jgi:chorismate-pyruvate lyase
VEVEEERGEGVLGGDEVWESGIEIISVEVPIVIGRSVIGIELQPSE